MCNQPTRKVVVSFSWHTFWFIATQPFLPFIPLLKLRQNNEKLSVGVIMEYQDTKCTSYNKIEKVFSEQEVEGHNITIADIIAQEIFYT